MKYMGSKNRIAKHILPIILCDRKPDQYYVEPFTGGANMIDKVEGLRIGGELNIYVVSLLKALQDGWQPPIVVTEQEWKYVKDNKELYPNHFVAYCGLALSFGSVWFCSYARDKKGNRNYAEEGFRNSLKQAEKLKGISFVHTDYRNLDIPNNSIVYCDPPYAGTDKYRGFEQINHEDFWQWCRDKVSEGHKLFISEFKAPKDFTEIWRLHLNTNMAEKTLGKNVVEKLFIHESQLEESLK